MARSTYTVQRVFRYQDGCIQAKGPTSLLYVCWRVQPNIVVMNSDNGGRCHHRYLGIKDIAKLVSEQNAGGPVLTVFGGSVCNLLFGFR